ncbi:kinesin-like protein KIF21A [Uloborus diversus]|uniref:kinesin-like protein KIF21A n=1 Tax=Uloborus diversus TaxID=327109 RepID=UPI0024098B14|nr:kinesin-like protein KIF21A [Uloborus diversus]
MTDDTAVKVVVRIRPLISRDILDLCHVCTTTVSNEPQIWIGNDKSYTFDEVFDMPTLQEDVFDSCVKELVDGCFDGYNATVLAYGQTGSGKTYTMGTGLDHSFQQDERGIIPRAVEHLFQKIHDIQEQEKKKGGTPPEFKVNAQFMELYNEEIIDLLDSTRDMDNKNRKIIRIHGDSLGQIYADGVIAQCVTNVQEALHCLKIGSLSRTTASTGMNTQSSRSHAIFTLHIKQQRLVKLTKANRDETCNSSIHEHLESLSDFETVTAKFHFVDLAGSERLKRTGATGDRQKESICINSGLLALGNVISALGDKSKKATHIPYRDSKLTRLLQDSLGGNSRTLMIACVSPSDRDFVETLSTLKYANRAKNIRNKVIANKDKSSQTISALIKQVENLQIELMEFKQGKRIIGDDGAECINDMYHENTMLQLENSTLKTRIKALQETIDRLTAKNTMLLVEKQSGDWITGGSDSKSDISAVIKAYVEEIESLRAKLIEYEESCALLRKQSQRQSPRCSFTPTSTVAITGQYDIRVDTAQSVTEVLEEAKKNVQRLKRKERKLKSTTTVKEKENVNLSDEDKDIADENENNEEVYEEDGSSSGSDTEKTDQDEKLSENLADLTCEISLKEKLIKQLEHSQNRIQSMRKHYEEKITLLQAKILETERERDKILSNLGKTSESKIEEKRIRADYEKKLSSLKNDMKTMESAKRQHVHFMNNASNSENQLKKLKQEVAEMKRAKQVLMNKMKEEAKKYRDVEQKRNREIAQLKKEKTKKESQIKALEADKKRKETMLQRRTEEIISLRKKTVVKCVSPKISGRWRTGLFSPKIAKQKWQGLEKKINKLVLHKQSIAAIEKDMDRWLKEREKLGRCLEKVTRKYDRAIMEGKGLAVIAELEDEIESLKANIDYVHENISDCQTGIMQMEEAKEPTDPADIIGSLKSMQFEESQYLIEKIVNMAINQSFQAAQKEATIKELESQLKQVIENNAVQEQLLFHVVQQANEHLSGVIELTAANNEELEHRRSNSNSRSPSPSDSMRSTYETPVATEWTKKRKARNMFVTKEQLLFSTAEPQDSEAYNNEINKTSSVPQKPAITMQTGRTNGDLNDKSRSYVILPATDQDAEINKYSELLSPSETKVINTLCQFKPCIDSHESQNSNLVRSHIIDGHNKPVLCVECTDDVLFTGSEDCSVKIWDLTTGTEIQTLKDHPSGVVKVAYCEYTRKAFSASSSVIKVWDVRQNPASVVHTFWSSPQQKRVHDPILASEYLINDIALNQYGTLLYSATSRVVQIWDLRMFESVGALNVGYGANVLSLAVTDVEFEKNMIVCGSEDKSIKVFEIKEQDFGVHQPRFSLSPPHYDAVEALAIYDSYLFTGSRDTSIRKWDLHKRSVVQTVQKAHKDSVCSLNILQGGDSFVSGSCSGSLKLWTMNRCSLIEEIKAHKSSINCITSNNSLSFTASSDCTVGVWKMNSGMRILH